MKNIEVEANDVIFKMAEFATFGHLNAENLENGLLNFDSQYHFFQCQITTNPMITLILIVNDTQKSILLGSPFDLSNVIMTSSPRDNQSFKKNIFIGNANFTCQELQKIMFQLGYIFYTFKPASDTG